MTVISRPLQAYANAKSVYEVVAFGKRQAQLTTKPK